jgi:diguanylate cyclase (GGDEF)-like protein
MGYLKNSFQKFKDDFFAKGIYDIIKGIGIAFILYIGTLFMPENFSPLKLLSTEYIIKLYCSILYTITVFVVSFLIYKQIYSRKYRALQNDNFTDVLTGLKNHKALYEFLKKTIDELNNSKIKSLSVIIIDVDDFKKFNTDFGHTKSDQVLKSLGELLNTDKRATDETFRQFLRGDEFVVITKDTNLGDAVKAAERKRKLVENNTFSVKDENFRLSVSCGVTEFKKEEDDIDIFLNRASQALAVAKEVKGKNNTKSNY